MSSSEFCADISYFPLKLLGNTAPETDVLSIKPLGQVMAAYV